MHRRGSWGILSLALLAGWITPSLAQQESDAWRREVDALLSRWTDATDTGQRLRRASEVLLAHLRDHPDESAARLELARVELARENCRAALLAADQVRDQLSERLEAGKDPEEVRDRLTTLHQRALALGFLATNYGVQQRLERTSDPADSEAYLREQGPAVAARRQALVDAVGEQAKEILSSEAERRRDLQELEQVGVEPRPLGQEDTDGEHVDFTRYEGRVVLVVFWSAQAPVGDEAIDLPECAAVVDTINALQQELADRLFVVVGVNLDRERERFDAFVEEHGLTGWRHVFAGQGWASEDAQAWSVRSVPAGVLIDHTGHVRYVDPWGPNLRLAVEDLLQRRDEDRR